MPANNTISSFYIFTDFTPTDVDEINSNFSLFRGHLLPIDGSVTAAANLAYDLGSDEHRWNTLNAAQIDLSKTSTSEMVIVGITNGGVSFQIDGVEKFAITDLGWRGLNTVPVGITTSAAIDGLAVSPIINSTITASGVVADSTLTIACTGRRLRVTMGDPLAVAGEIEPVSPTAFSTAIFTVYQGVPGTSTANVVCTTLMNQHNLPGYRLPGNAIGTVYTPGPGTFTYWLRVDLSGVGFGVYINNLRLVAREF